MGQAKLRGTKEERIRQAQERVKLENQNIQDKKEQVDLPLYRFFETKEYADTFANGEIWISTLKECRKHDDPQQGDPDEGSMTYQQGVLIIENRVITQEDYDIAHSASIGIPEPGTFVKGPITLIGNSKTRFINNAYLLCTTSDPNAITKQSNNWKYGVKINLPKEDFHKIVTSAFDNKRIILTKDKHGWAKYGDNRVFYDYKRPPTDLAFIKPNRHAVQSEYRFLWISNEEHDYKKGILLNCPSLKPYLEKLY